ncbi:hypothetical protein EB14_02258 [Enterococcus faecium]|nr:hypothetical protein [Enterococcus faecium]RBS30815.1 hypothetical protein EB14_02258 [Enterococcus faecium]
MSRVCLSVISLRRYFGRLFGAVFFLFFFFFTGDLLIFCLVSFAFSFFGFIVCDADFSFFVFYVGFLEFLLHAFDGLFVFVVGRLSLYVGGGSSQFCLSRLAPGGIGAFYPAFAECRDRLLK